MVKTMPVPPPPPDDVTDPAKTGKYAEPLTSLRAGSVDIDARRIGRAIGVLLLAALVVVAIVLAVAGAQKNNQINQLRHHGVPVTITVSSCQGLLGGSGSNAAGYTCRGTFTAAGHRYTEGIPGNTLYPPGSTIRAVRVPGDPALVTPLTVLATEQASWRVYLLPAVLLVAAALLVRLLLYSRRRTRGTTPMQPEVA